MAGKKCEGWILNSILVVILLLVLQSLSGCTMAVWKMRKEREAEIGKVSRIRTIVDVRSGWILEDGTTTVCVAVTDASAAKPMDMAMRISYARIMGKTRDELNPTPQMIFNSKALTEFFYPLKKAEKGCEPSPQSVQLPIHDLHLPIDYQDKILEIIGAPEYNSFDNPTLFKVYFSLDPETNQSSSDSVMLVFRPSSKAGNPDPFGIPGLFEPESEAVNPYTLLLPPALLFDAAITVPICVFFGNYF